jgi:hypothetical protein
MVSKRSLACVIFGCGILACAAHRNPIGFPSNTDAFTGLVNSLQATGIEQRKCSGLLIRPDNREEQLWVSRSINGYGVTIFFCPEAGDVQERELFESIGRTVDKYEIIGEVRCGRGKWFNFPSSAATGEFLRKAAEVMNFTSFHYSTDCSMRGEWPANNPIEQSVHPVTHLACASCAPGWPAAHRVRYPDRTR